MDDCDDARGEMALGDVKSTEQKELSICCNAPLIIECMGYFHDKDKVCTQYYVCTKCKKHSARAEKEYCECSEVYEVLTEDKKWVCKRCNLPFSNEKKLTHARGEIYSKPIPAEKKECFHIAQRVVDGKQYCMDCGEIILPKPKERIKPLDPADVCHCDYGDTDRITDHLITLAGEK